MGVMASIKVSKPTGRAGNSPESRNLPISMVEIRETGHDSQVSGVQADGSVNIREVWRALLRRKKLVGLTTFVIFTFSAATTIHERLFKPVYQGSFALLITDPISNEGRGGGSSGNPMFEQLARNTTNSDIPTLIEVLKSPLLLSPIANRFGLNVDGLAGRISISGGEGRGQAEGILKVSLIGRDPVEDERLLNVLSDTYLQAALQQRQQRLADGIAFLNKQAPALEQKTDQIQAEVANFRRNNSLLEPSTEGGALKARETEMSTQVLSLEAERNRLLKVRQEIVNGTLTATGFQEAVGASGGVGLTISDVDQSLLQQLLTVETELAEARSTYNSDSSMVLGLEARVRELQPLLRQNQLGAVDSALNLNADRLATAKAQEQELNAQFLKQPALIKQYEALQTRLKIAQENLAGLVSARENFQLEIAQRAVPWRVIDPPEMNPNPIQPSVPRNLMRGALLSLAIGAGVGLLRDRMDHVFHHSGDVKDELGLPLLGHIPYVGFFQGVRENKRFMLKELDSQVLHSGNEKKQKEARYERFFYQEAFRNLYTSLRFLNSDRPLRSIALTSSLPAEGKSLVNTLLAKTICEMGQRVLLVDADMRKPQMHTRLGLNNLRGLSNLLSDEVLDWRKALQTVEGYDGWSVISAGRRPPDPARLLSSDRMHQLVQDLLASDEFDLILFDTPPVLGLADAALVAEHCDGLMLLVSLDRVDRGLPRESVQRIRSSGVPLLGVVTNALKKESTYKQSYGYGKYGYNNYGGYGYAAYNSASAYSHYADVDDESQIASANSNASTNLLERLSKRRQQLMRWLDS